MKDCLEDHREDPGFSAECKEEFEIMMEARAADFRCALPGKPCSAPHALSSPVLMTTCMLCRLDSTLREVCAEDIESVCGYERDSRDTVEGFDARVIQCLQVRCYAKHR